MTLYYPLGLRSKVDHEIFGFIPSKKFSKYKRELKSELKPSNELGNIFADIYRRLKNCTTNSYHTLYKRPDQPEIINLLKTLIPDSYYGSSKNKKKIFFVITRILTQTRGEFIHMCTLYEGYEYDNISWLIRSKDTIFNRKNKLLMANLLLLQTVVKPLIRYFYYYVTNFRDRKVLVAPLGQLHSFVDRNIHGRLQMGHIKKILREPSKKVRLNGALQFIPKKSLSCLDCRPIVLNSRANRLPLDSLKEKLKMLIKQYQIGSEKCLYQKWRIFTEYNKNRKKLYAVKLDLTDAFGMVDLEVIKTIISNDDQFLSDPQKLFLHKMMFNQYVYVHGSKQYYQWCHGLLQGTPLSPILCDLYLSYLMYEHLRHFEKPNSLIHRTVDDILFMSTCDSDVHEFELAAMKVFLLNEDKSKTFVHTGDNPNILYCGKMFNMITRESSNLYAFKEDTELRIKFKLWNPKKQIAPGQAYKFMVNSMKFCYVNYCFSRYELNTTCNSVDTVLKNIYDGMCYVAFKLDCVAESIGYLFHNLKDRCRDVSKVIRFISYTYCQKIQKFLEKYKGENHKRIFKNWLLKFIINRAFIIVLKKRSAQYKYVIDKLEAQTKNYGVPVTVSNYHYFYKLPKPFENIKMHRKQKCL